MNERFQHVDQHFALRPNSKMQEVLMDPQAEGPANHYYMIRGGKDQTNITVLEPGTVGGEYIKTYGHYHIGQLDETYKFLSGEGVVLLQKLASDEKGNMIPDMVEEFKAIEVGAGHEPLFIPASYGHLIINTGSTYFTTADDSPVDFEERDPVSLPGHANYELVQRMRGFAFYLVEHEGKPALKINVMYKDVRNAEFGNLPVIS